MAFFVVTYDLRKKNEFEYQPLWDEFDRLDAVKYQESDYLLCASNTVAEVKNHFDALMHEDDLLMVIEFTDRPEWTKGLKGTKDWINKHWSDYSLASIAGNSARERHTLYLKGDF